VSIKHLISPGVGFSPGSIKYIITRGFVAGEAVEEAITQPTGGWIPRKKRKREDREERIRLERIKMGILERETLKLPEKTKEHPEKPEVFIARKARSFVLSDSEINKIRNEISSEIDIEIALYLRNIEKRNKILLALNMMLVI